MLSMMNEYMISGEPLHGVVLRNLSPSKDQRGSFTEVFQSHWPGPIDPVQWSVVHSVANVLRGLHLHLNHDEYFMVVEGKSFVGLRDVRLDSPTRNRSCLFELSGTDPVALMFPRGILHGWYFPESSFHVQAVSESYKDYSAYDNLGCSWSDPALEIPWPCSDPILSERARDFRSLKELLATISEIIEQPFAT